MPPHLPPHLPLNRSLTRRGHLRGRRYGFAALLLAMVLLQTVGVVHKVLHAGGLHAHAELADRSDVFAHGDEADCRLFDQLAQGDLAWSAPPAAASLPALFLFTPALPGGHLAAQAAGYLARGPPHA